VNLLGFRLMVTIIQHYSLILIYITMQMILQRKLQWAHAWSVLVEVVKFSVGQQVCVQYLDTEEWHPGKIEADRR
jgi:hypothetical protein